MAKAAPHADEPAAAAPPASGGSFMGRLMVIALVMVVVVVECVVAYLCIPPASTQASLEGSGPFPKSSADRKKAEHEPILASESESAEVTEVDLGEFSVTVFQPASNSTMRFDFHVFGTIDVKEKKKFDELYDKYKQRIREQVNTTIRSAEMADLTDPSLGLIKRSILDKARTALGQPLLRDVLIPDFSFIEN